MRRGLANSIVALAAFVATCGALHAWLPSPRVRDVTAKLEFFASHKHEFETVFLGSSHVHYAVAPSVFDQVLAGAGIANRTYNFGADGMHPPEQFYVLEQILAMKPRNLKHLFLEMDDVEVSGLPGKQISQRTVYWHDWKRTALILRKILDADVSESWPRKFRALRRWRAAIAGHLNLFGRNLCNVGRVFDLVAAEDVEQREWELGPRRDGYAPLDTKISGGKLAALEGELARERAARIEPVAIDGYAAAAYRDYARQIHDAGATPVLLVPPVLPQLPSQLRGPAPCLLLAYNNPGVYPDFYRSDARMDPIHLNPAGAESFTRLVAADFVRSAPRP
ncbi:MAG TPA: hypothetical protein VF511_04880 [Chthoniobacterales bacterium]|jgi:hypothetical protein